MKFNYYRHGDIGHHDAILIPPDVFDASASRYGRFMSRRRRPMGTHGAHIIKSRHAADVPPAEVMPAHRRNSAPCRAMMMMRAHFQSAHIDAAGDMSRAVSFTPPPYAQGLARLEFYLHAHAISLPRILFRYLGFTPCAARRLPAVYRQVIEEHVIIPRHDIAAWPGLHPHLHI